MANNINARIENIIKFYNMGGNPQQLMQNMMMQNSDIGQMKTQIQNMSQGRTPKDFIVQMARQNGVTEQNIQGLLKILDKN